MAGPPQVRRPCAVFIQSYEALGDAIVHIAAYRALRAGLPGVRMVNLVRRNSTFTGALAKVSHLFFDEVIIGADLINSPRALAAWLREHGGDYVFEYRANGYALRSWLAAGMTGGRHIANVAGFALRRRLPGLAEQRPAHNYLRYHRMVEIALGKRLAFDASLPVSPGAAAAAALRLPGGSYVGIAPGPRDSNKHWPLERHAALAQRLSEMGATPVYLLGPLEDEYRTAVAAAAPMAIILGPAEAGGDGGELPWLIHAAARRMAAVVAIEGGLGHLAATHDMPIVTLSGPTHAVRWKPVTSRWTNIRAQDFGGKAMAAIPDEAVVHAVAAILDKTAP
jgi:ADP-heptose:LPS heptosyltransferase